MALTPEQIADILFKKIAASFSNSSVSKNYFEENIVSRLAVFSSQIWAEEDKIPVTAPVSSTEHVAVIQDLELIAVPGSNNRSFSHTELKDVIPFNYGDGSYNYTIKNSQGTRIDLGQNDWYLDPDSGTLTFFDGVPANMPPKISCYKYTGLKGFASSGGSGYLVVNLLRKIATREVEGTFDGQLACVLETDELYMWKTDTNQVPYSTSWVKVSSGSGANEVPPASMQVAGKVKTSNPNPNGSNDYPIVVETNDPRMSDSRNPRVHNRSHWDDSINTETGLRYSQFDRIPDASATNAGLLNPENYNKLQNISKLPYPLDQKLHGQFVGMDFNATGASAPFSELDLTLLAQANGWKFTTNLESKGIITGTSEPLSKIYLYKQNGDKLVDQTTNKEIYARLVVTNGSWKLKYYYTDNAGIEQIYTFTQVPTEIHRAKVPQIFDLWDMPTFDPTLAAPGAVPDTIPTATSTTLGVVTLGGDGAFAAAPNLHVLEEETAHGGLVSGIKVNAEENSTPPGVVIFKSGAGMTITRAGNEITFYSTGGAPVDTGNGGGGDGGDGNTGGGGTDTGGTGSSGGTNTVNNAFAGADGKIGLVSLSAAPLNASLPVALSESDTRVVMKSQSNYFDNETVQSLRNLIVRSQKQADVSSPAIGQIIRNENNVLVEYTGTAWVSLLKAHGSDHLPNGSDPIPYATTTQGGLMSPAQVLNVHTKEDTTSLQNKKKAALIHGGLESGISGGSIDVSSKMSSYPAASSYGEEGIVVFSPYNKVNLVDKDTGNPVKDGADEVFGRLTKAGSVWTLTFYKMVGTTEVPYSLSNRTFNWYVQRVFNLLTMPIFDTNVSVPSGVVDAVARDASKTEKGVVFIGGTGTEDNRAPTYTQLKEHIDDTQAHGGLVNKFGVLTFEALSYSILTGNVYLSASNKFKLSLSSNTINLDTNPAQPLHLSAITGNKPNLSLKPGTFPTADLVPGSLHIDNGGQLWVNMTGNSGDLNWKTIGSDYSIERFVVGGNTGLLPFTGVIMGADGKVIQATSTSTAGDNRSVGIIVAVNGGGSSASPGDTVFVKIDGLLRNVPIYNTAQAGDYLILKAGIMGKLFSVGTSPSPYTIARAIKPSQNGFVDVIIVRVSGGVGAGGTRIIDEWDKESASYADGSVPYPRTADSNGSYRFYLSREPILSQGVVVVAANVRQPKAKYRVMQDLVPTSANYLKWYVALKYPLILDTDTLFVEYFTA